MSERARDVSETLPQKCAKYGHSFCLSTSFVELPPQRVAEEPPQPSPMRKLNLTASIGGA